MVSIDSIYNVRWDMWISPLATLHTWTTSQSAFLATTRLSATNCQKEGGGFTVKVIARNNWQSIFSRSKWFDRFQSGGLHHVCACVYQRRYPRKYERCSCAQVRSQPTTIQRSRMCVLCGQGPNYAESFKGCLFACKSKRQHCLLTHMCMSRA